MIMNMKKTCEKNGIHEFSRTRGGWMKIVEGYDKSQHGGFRFVGSNFVKVGNYDVDLANGLYIDCSKHFDKEDEKVVEIMNLFKIHDGDVELLKSVPKAQKGWAYEMDDVVEDYFANDEATPLDVLNAIREVTSNKEVLHKVAMELFKEERGKVWLNELHFQSHMAEADVYKGRYDLTHTKVEKMMEELHKDIKLYHKAIRYFDDEIYNEHERNSIYAFIHAHPNMRDYKDFEPVFETIKENYYIDLENVKKLRAYNQNLLTETQGKALGDNGYYFTFQHGTWATHKVVYIVVPNVVKEKILIQKFELQIV